MNIVTKLIINGVEYELTDGTSIELIRELQINKQDKLTAGTGIDITNNTISNTYHYDDSELLNLINDKQDKLSAGTGIDITDNTISNTYHYDDSELINLINDKQDKLILTENMTLHSDSDGDITIPNLTPSNSIIISAIPIRTGSYTQWFTLLTNSVSGSGNYSFKAVNDSQQKIANTDLTIKIAYFRHVGG